MRAVQQQYDTAEGLTQNFMLLPSKLRLVAILSLLKWKCEPDPATKVKLSTYFHTSSVVCLVSHLQ